MSLELYLWEHIKKYPFIQPQDIIKLCYQAANGAEHLLEDVKAAEAYFKSEYDKVPAIKGELYEKISDEVCRVHLSAWKASGMPEKWLFQMFVASAESFSGDRKRLDEYLDIAGVVIHEGEIEFSEEEWMACLERYIASGKHPVHHSEIFHKEAEPAYRIISTRFLCIFPILEAAAALLANPGIKTIVLEGRAASGKSTRAGMLQKILNAECIHMDDFFLPPILRNKERLEEAGGNVHYERFLEEVLPYLKTDVAFSYRKFSCSKMNFDGRIFIGTQLWRIVEGSYSHHPIFGDYGDLRVFCDVDPEEQMRRILERNGPEMAKMFKERWIPMEERYFTEYKISSKADVCLKNEKVFVQY